MEIACAECNCRVDRGEVLERCETDGCCCAHLPDRDAATATS